MSSSPWEKSARQSPILQSTALPAMGPWPTLDPFLFCVHHQDNYPAGNEFLGPATSLAGRHLGQDFAGVDGWSMYHGHQIPGFPKHPHRGFETITVVEQGLIDHADSLGAKARYGDGDVQWLTAGDGINHAEMFPLLKRNQENPTDFFQIWLNLPAKNKRVAPHFSMMWNKDIPLIKKRDPKGRATTVKIIAGQYNGSKALAPPPHSWASFPQSAVAIFYVQMQAHAQWLLSAAPSGAQRALYTVSGGDVQVAGETMATQQLIQLQADRDVGLQGGSTDSTWLLLQARPIGEPVARYGPFVMNTKEEIAQAIADYRRSEFGGWPWEKVDPTHGSDYIRFARRPDGTVEKPT